MIDKLTTLFSYRSFQNFCGCNAISLLLHVIGDERFDQVKTAALFHTCC